MKQILTLTLLFNLLFSIATAQDNNSLIASLPKIESAIKKHNEALYKEAINLYRKIPRSDTNYVRALIEMGMSYAANCQFTEALKVYTEGLSLKLKREKEPDLYNNYASLVDDKGNPEKERSLYNFALFKYPTNSPKGIIIEDGNYYTGELNGAIKYYKYNDQLKETRLIILEHN